MQALLTSLSLRGGVYEDRSAYLLKSTSHNSAEEIVETYKNKEYEFKFVKNKAIGIESLGELSAKEPTLFDKLKGYNKLYEEADLKKKMLRLLYLDKV